MNPRDRKPTAGRKPPASTASISLAEFLEAESVPKSTFFRWKALGVAPKTYRLPNGRLRIRVSDYEAWQAGLGEERAA